MSKASILLLLTTLLLTPCLTVFSADTSRNYVSVHVTREVDLNIKIVLIGPYFNLNIIDVNLLRSILPSRKPNLVLIDENVTG